jgi:hypothetical protein
MTTGRLPGRSALGSAALRGKASSQAARNVFRHSCLLLVRWNNSKSFLILMERAAEMRARLERDEPPLTGIEPLQGERP